jgi:hypothetical protein
MACDTAFRIIARRYLDALSANKEATCNGDAMALSPDARRADPFANGNPVLFAYGR